MDNESNYYAPNTDVLNLSDEELRFFHKILHFYFKMNQLDKRKPYGWCQEDILSCHSRASEELIKRNIGHSRQELIDEITCVDNKSKVNSDHKVYVSEEELANAIFGEE